MLLCRDVELGELGRESGRPAPSQADLPIDDWPASEMEDQQEERRQRQLDEDWERKEGGGASTGGRGLGGGGAGGRG